MRLNKQSVALISAAAVLGALGVAGAQPQGDAPAGPAPAADLSSKKAVDLTMDQKVSEGKRIMASIAAKTKAVTQQLSQARAKKDPIAVPCLDDLVSQLGKIGASAEEHSSSLNNAAKRNDDGAASHSLTMVRAQGDNADSVAAQANTCVGAEERGVLEDTVVDVTIDPDIPNTDPSEFPDDPILSDPPVLSSPTK